MQAFDALNRLVTITDAANGVTSYTYDARDNRTSVTDPRGLTTTYTYDGLDRLTQKASPDTGTTTYTYDAAGNRLSQTDARGITTQFTYDALNRLTAITYPDTSQNVTYTYDTCTNGVGRVCAMQDESGTTTYAYDARGNIVTKTTVRDGITQSISYAYNNADQLTQITYPDGRTVDYTRNSLGQVTGVTTTAGGNTVTLASNVGYEPFGPIDALTYGNGIARTESYDEGYRLTAITSGVQDRVYTYDAANNITVITNNLDTSRSQSFIYDGLNRLTDASGIYGAFTYTYDADGNRLTKSTNSGMDTYTYDTASNRLLQVQVDSTMTIDQQFVYGDNNRLQEVQTSGLTVGDYTYNGWGERVKKVDTNISYYNYSQQGQLLAESDGTGAVGREYVYLNGQPLAVIEGGNIYTIHTDHLGTPQIITDTNQQEVWKADYQPFGQANITTEAITNNLRFPGQYFDADSGLHYNHFRYYDSLTGRYITSDPIGLVGGLNTYAYVEGNPVGYADPYGLINFVLTRGGSYIRGLGGEGNGGIYLTLQWAPNFIDIGVFGSGGIGIGHNTSLSEEFGIIKGNVNDIRGISYNLNGGIAPGGGTLIFNGNGEIIGATVGEAIEYGLSWTYVKTGAVGLNDLGRWLGIWLYNKLHPNESNCP